MYLHIHILTYVCYVCACMHYVECIPKCILQKSPLCKELNVCTCIAQLRIRICKQFVNFLFECMNVHACRECQLLSFVSSFHRALMCYCLIFWPPCIGLSTYIPAYGLYCELGIYNIIIHICMLSMGTSTCTYCICRSILLCPLIHTYMHRCMHIIIILVVCVIVGICVFHRRSGLNSTGEIGSNSVMRSYVQWNQLNQFTV